MVDLVKIRKKAKQAKDVSEAAEATPAAPAPPETARHAVAVEPAAPEKDPPALDLSSPASSTAPPAPAERSTATKLERFKDAAGRRRAVALAGQDAPVVEQLELLTFMVAGEQYAVDIEKIVEIVTPRPITKIPNCDRAIVGIVSLRGAIVTLLDVRHKLRHGERVSAGDPRIIVVEQKGETVGFEVDRVLRVVKLEAGAVEPNPVLHASEQDEAVRGVFRQGAALTILLDLDKLLNVA